LPIRDTPERSQDSGALEVHIALLDADQLAALFMMKNPQLGADYPCLPQEKPEERRLFSKKPQFFILLTTVSPFLAHFPR
jgi:hypothetical protein